MATKRRAASDSVLERYHSEWQEARNKLAQLRALKKAADHCEDHHLAEPAWLLEVFCELGRAQVTGLKKTGRPSDIVNDAMIWETFERYRRTGCTKVSARKRTSLKYFGDENRRYTVKSACERHEERIMKVIDTNNPEGWYFKREYLKGGKAKDFASLFGLFMRSKTLNDQRHAIGSNAMSTRKPRITKTKPPKRLPTY